MSLAQRIQNKASKLGEFKLSDLYKAFPKEKATTIRGRVYRELMGLGIIERREKGIYVFRGNHGEEGAIITGDARDLSSFKTESLDLIVADHPYETTLKAVNSDYRHTTFRYNLDDFKEKARTLKKGAFLVEFMPEMKETNWEYLFEVMSYAQAAGLTFYTKVPWYKAQIRGGVLVDSSARCGRKAVMEDVYIFTKGTPRKLRYRMQSGKMQNEQGAAFMLPAVFMEPPITPSRRIHKAEKPEALIKQLIQALTKEGEVVLDQFAGSLVTFFTALKLKRRAVAIELDEEKIEKSIERSKEAV